jgi:hypothetical protein
MLTMSLSRAGTLDFAATFVFCFLPSSFPPFLLFLLGLRAFAGRLETLTNLPL